jgi:RNA polymerase sigma-70 factor (ECF subfamily)
VREPADAGQRALVDHYAAAIENADVAALTRLLLADATFAMPPEPAWLRGRDAIGRFLAVNVLREPGDLRVIPTSANGQPALAVYRRDCDGVHRAHVVQVLTCTPAGIAAVVAFRNPGLFAAFGLPREHDRLHDHEGFVLL